MKFVTFGEIMLRLAPRGTLRFLQEPVFEATFGGGEANVAVSLANFGMDAEFVTALPKNDIGQSAVNELRKFGVETKHIVRSGKRVGIYYCEKGASQRPSKVIYDRAGSSVSESSIADYDFDAIFAGADWFHFTGITPALSAGCAEICLKMAEYCRAHKITVSCDLNYRKNLWSTAEACETMTKLIQYVDVCIANEEDAEKVFGICSKESNPESGVLHRDGYIGVAEKIAERFGIGTVAITLRESISADDNRWSAMLWQNGDARFSQMYNIHIVDRVGGGDSFCAGLIYALLHKFDGQEAVEFASAASCLKHSVQGDFNRVSVQEVVDLMRGNGSGRVQR